VITNIYNRKIKGRTLIELFIATGKLKKGFYQHPGMVCFYAEITIKGYINILNFFSGA